MPARDRPTAAVERRRWRVSLSLLLCMAAAIAGLHTVLDGFGWWPALVGVVVAVLGVAAVARAVTPRRWVPPLAASAVLIMLLTVVFAPRDALLWAVPSRKTLEALAELAEAGGASIGSQSVPASVDIGILFLLGFGVGALALAGDLVANTARLPALAGVAPLIVLAIPATTGLERSDPITFALAAIAYLALLRSGRPGMNSGQAFAVGAVAVVASLMVPLVMPPAEPLPSTRASAGLLSGVNPVLNLGADLRRQLDRTMMTYSTESGDGQYLRLTTLQNFTADSWEPAEVPVTPVSTSPDLQRPPGLDSAVAREQEITSIAIDNLASPWLPVPYPATAVDGLRGEWGWDTDALTLSSGSSSARGQRYEVHSLIVQPTPQQLLDAGSSVPEGFGHYLELPVDLPPVIAETARYVAADATSNYQRAVALQEFLRDGEFVYSEDAPVEQGYDGNGMFVLARFLDVKSGYCVHFSSAMAVMARVLDIPSRVAVGTLPGVRSRVVGDDRAIMRVTTSDLHAWPELYFEGVGWIRFEPTPSRGAVPSYADEQEPGVPTPPAPTSAAPNPTAPPVDAGNPLLPSDQPTPDAATAQVSLAGLWWTGSTLAAIALVLLLPAFVRSGQRSRRLRALADGAPLARTGWREILQTAEDLGVAVPSTATPRIAALAIDAEAAAGSGRDVTELSAVVSQLEAEAYAPPSALESESRVGAVLRVLDRLRSRVSRRERMAARFAPRSIWQRLAAFVRRPD